MKILELCEFYSNYSGNFIPSLEALEQELKKCGHSVLYIFSNKNLSEDFLRWETPFSKSHNVLLMNFESKHFVKRVAEFIRENEISIVHGHFLSSKLFSDIKKRSNKKVSFYQHIHNSFYIRKNLSAFLKRVRNLLFLSHKIKKICCSSSIVESARYTFPLSKIVTVKNAIDFSRLEKSNFHRLQQNNILLFGHNYYIKGVDIAIEAVNKLMTKYDAHLDIVMGDNFENNSNIIMNKYGCIPSFISILKPTNDVNLLYKTHQIFLNASFEEGMSYANIEAYYSGCLFVSSDIPQNLEPNLPNVLYFKSGSIDDLYRSLEEAFNNKNNYSNDCDYVENFFSTKRWAKDIMNIFNIS